MISGSNHDIDTVLSKAYEVLAEKNKSIVKVMQKIEDTKKSVDFLPDELKSCFEGVHDFTKCLTIEPSSVEFLQPYLKEEHLLNIIEQIPQNPPAVERFTLLDSSSILGNQEQKDQLNAAIREIVPNFKSF